MKFFKRLLGICETPTPNDPDAWTVANGVVSIDLARMPELDSPGGGVRLEGKDSAPRLLVFHGDDGQHHAVSNRCTHMGRRIDPIAGSKIIQCCSVSKSTYTYDGKPVGGAAKKPLQTYPVELEGKTLKIKI
ncbi:Rieske (2Fe-2S) protein [uncultured Desulfosarcina sp.]|uniref:QcrA and Rieske domain-containing protein n=1 Tax=uncultured Desulfosarcina sp. TaxID=218289 RepID=UPI0029C6B543|nr:Rieske (2Fe-2S) protein [uncultured Desulfosarcina sp.]